MWPRIVPSHFVLAPFTSHRREVLLQDAIVDSEVPVPARLVSHTLLWKKLPSRSSKSRASRIASTPGVLMADILRVGRVWRRHDVLDRNGAPPLSFCFWSHCPDLNCWTAFLRNHDVLIAPVTVSYPRGIVKSWLQRSLLFDLLVAPLGLGQHLLTELIHLAMEILACGIIHSKMAMVSVICTPLLASDPNLVALNCPFTSWTPLLSAPPFACGSYAGGFSWDCRLGPHADDPVLHLHQCWIAISLQYNLHVLRVTDAPHYIVHDSIVSSPLHLHK